MPLGYGEVVETHALALQDPTPKPLSVPPQGLHFLRLCLSLLVSPFASRPKGTHDCFQSDEVSELDE